MIAVDMMQEMNTEPMTQTRGSKPEAPKPSCYSITLFTQKWKEIRDFYKEALGAEIVSERTNRYCDMVMAGLPISLRPCEFGEDVSYFHVYLAMKERSRILDHLRRRGIIVTQEGPYANFRDPEGRVFKLSESEAILS